MTPEDLAKLLFDTGQLIANGGDTSEVITWEHVPDEAKAFKIAVASELLHQYVLVPVGEIGVGLLR